MRLRIFILINLVTASTAFSQESELKAYLDSAATYRLSGDTMEVYYLSKAIALQPLVAQLYELRAYAKSFIVDKDPNKYGPKAAIKDFDVAIKLAPKNPIYYEQRGYQKYLLGNYYSALTDLNKAIRFDKKSASAYRKRGDILWELNNYPRAGNDFYTASTLDTTSLYTLRKVGDCYYELGNYYEAVSYYNQVIKKSEAKSTFKDIYNEEYVLALLYQANANGGMRALKKAVEGYDKVIEYNEDFKGVIDYSQEAYRYRGVAYLADGEKSKGCEDLKAAEKLGDPEATEYLETYCK